ncbi:hypothetical protein [Mahella sp.]|uniref:hypothetical protein n=1 Tax=Mahella sp. TaxID=2798721 RepID=UPI0025C0D0D2|nr:hypothetical protein [Mahella sp.]MBZ4666213.1 hypothetical protein [Mahella sp.]
MDNIFDALISELEGKKGELKHKSVAAGFYGFIDKAVRVVKENKNESAFTGEPKLLTGGSDNYGAGFCIGQLLDMDLPCSTLLGNAVAGFYVRYGRSPSVEGALSFLCRWQYGNTIPDISGEYSD